VDHVSPIAYLVSIWLTKSRAVYDGTMIEENMRLVRAEMPAQAKAIIEYKKDPLYGPGIGYYALLECGHTLWMAHEPVLAGKVTCSTCSREKNVQ